MATKSITAKKATLSIKLGSAAAVRIAGITSFTGLGGGTAAVLDATDLDSEAKEKQIGLADEGQVSLEMNHLPDDAGQKALAKARNDAEVAVFVWTLASGKTYTFDGYVLSFAKSFAVDSINKASCSIEITGEVVEGEAA